MTTGLLWNPVEGVCPYRCLYCTERFLAIYRGEHVSVLLNKNRLIPLDADNIAVSNQLDLFAKTVPDNIIEWVFHKIQERPQQTFFFSTKNPERYFQFAEYLPKNATYCATIESNRNYPFISGAPAQSKRLYWLKKIREKLPSIQMEVIIQPILEFDFDKFLSALIVINPNEITISWDLRTLKKKLLMPARGRELPEPTGQKAWSLARQLLLKTNIRVYYYPKRTMKDVRMRHRITVDVSNAKRQKEFIDLFTA